MKRFIWLVSLVAMLFGLSACSTGSASLPLAQGKPTLLFFYTEN
jgi:hypothetical protein